VKRGVDLRHVALQKRRPIKNVSWLAVELNYGSSIICLAPEDENEHEDGG